MSPLPDCWYFSSRFTLGALLGGGGGVLPAQHGAWPGMPTPSSSSDIPIEGRRESTCPPGLNLSLPFRTRVPGPREASVCRPIPARTPGLGFLTSSSLKSPPPSCPHTEAHTEARQPRRSVAKSRGRSHPCCCPSRARRPGSLHRPPAPAPPVHSPTSRGAQKPPPTPQPPRADAGMGPCPLPANHCAEVGRRPSFRKPLRAQRPLVSAPPGLRVPPWTSRRQAQHETRCPPAG